MSALTRFVPSILQRATVCFAPISNKFHLLTQADVAPLSPGGLFNVTMRTNIRVHFPRPNETKRIKVHGWKKRMSTPAGRRILMNRILKGRFVYSH